MFEIPRLNDHQTYIVIIEESSGPELRYVPDVPHRSYTGILAEALYIVQMRRDYVREPDTNLRPLEASWNHKGSSQTRYEYVVWKAKSEGILVDQVDQRSHRSCAPSMNSQYMRIGRPARTSSAWLVGRKRM